MAVLLALFLRDRMKAIVLPERGFLALAFAFTAFSEILHALVGVEWSGWLAWVEDYSGFLRPATYPPTYYLLPIAMAWMLWLTRRGPVVSLRAFAWGLGALSIALLMLSLYLPPYVDTGILGIQRPTQIPLVFLWAWVIYKCWHERQHHPLCEDMMQMSVLLWVANLFLLYSPSPHEKFAMMAHFGTLIGYLLLLRSLVRIATKNEQEHTKSEQRVHAIMEHVLDGIITINDQGIIESFNPAAERLFGYPANKAINHNVSMLMPEPYHSKHDGYINNYLTTGIKKIINIGREVVGKRKDGLNIPNGFLHRRDAGGEQRMFIGSVRDITERKQAEQELKLSAMVYRAIGEAIMVTDADNRIIAVNPAFTQLTGYTEQEAVGQFTNLLKSGQHGQDFYRDMWSTLETTGRRQGEIWNRRKNGELYREWLAINTIFDEHGAVQQRIAMFSEITGHKLAEQAIWKQANFDPLTGLPNRRMFYDRLGQEVKRSHRTGLPMALMFLDLDHFKEVNDTLGHDVGDALLKEASQRLHSCIRETDTVSRLGGDEFTVILGELDDSGSVNRVANDILRNLSEPFRLGDKEAHVSASIGITLYPKDGMEIEELIKNADQAMYEAKRQGRNCHSYFVADHAANQSEQDVVDQ